MELEGLFGEKWLARLYGKSEVLGSNTGVGPMILFTN